MGRRRRWRGSNQLEQLGQTKWKSEQRKKLRIKTGNDPGVCVVKGLHFIASHHILFILGLLASASELALTVGSYCSGERDDNKWVALSLSLWIYKIKKWLIESEGERSREEPVCLFWLMETGRWNYYITSRTCHNICDAKKKRGRSPWPYEKERIGDYAQLVR